MSIMIIDLKSYRKKAVNPNISKKDKETETYRKI